LDNVRVEDYQRIEDDRIDISAKAGYVTLGIAIGAILGAAVMYLRRLRADRPPIIVKNGSITFENHGKVIGWAGDGQSWTPDQSNGDDVTGLYAEVLAGGGKNCVSPLFGTSLNIEFDDGAGTPRTFTVFIAGKKPKIRPGGLLSKDGTGKQLRHGQSGLGRIARISAPNGDACSFSQADAVIRISFTK
jgi:hypothetical protein